MTGCLALCLKKPYSASRKGEIILQLYQHLDGYATSSDTARGSMLLDEDVFFKDKVKPCFSLKADITTLSQLHSFEH